MEELLEHDVTAIQYLSLEFLTDEICKMYITKSPSCIKYIPPEFQSTEICTITIEHDPYLISHIHNPSLSTLCLALSKRGQLIHQVPPQRITLELIKTAIQNDPRSFQYVQNHSITLANIQLLYDLNNSIILYTTNIDIYTRIIQHNPTSTCVKQILQIVKSWGNNTSLDALYSAIVSVQGSFIKYFPIKSMNLSICKSAIQSDPSSIKHIPHRALSNIQKTCGTKRLYKFYQDCITLDPMTIQHIPKSSILYSNITQTKELCICAVLKNGMALQHCAYKTPEICLYAVRNVGMSLEHVPKKLRTQLVCEEAVKCDGMAVQFVKNPTFDIKKYALEQNHDAKIFLNDG